MPKLCKDPKKAEKDAGKVAERVEAGEKVYACKQCGRQSHKESHLCAPKKLKADTRTA